MSEIKKTAKKTPKAARKPVGVGAFAVVETGGKQYIVRSGQTLKIEKLEAKEGDKVTFDNVLLHSDGAAVSVGAPHVTGVKVEATVLGQGRAKKILVMKYRPKSRYMKRNGHRQPFTEVEITTV